MRCQKKGKNKWRLIVDLIQLNQYIDPPPKKKEEEKTNEEIKEVQDLIESNDNIITADLKMFFLIILHWPLSLENTCVFNGGENTINGAKSALA